MFTLLCSDTAQRHTLVNRTVVADHRRLTDDNAAAVVNQNTVSELCTRMNLNQCKKAGHLRNPSGNEKHVMLIKPMGKPVPDECMNSLI